ncbi:MAG: response regulator receiver modulated diguanylate phosphodiesterase [Ilumatobacteraceae bacterium]|nr:response regulator receiver modulated diguanylate phosphodiesterase [Ilumatobacteraceae bacterium]
MAPGGIRSVRQPIVRVRDGSIVGWEALSRIADPSLGIAGPLEALELAEAEGRRIDFELACIVAAIAEGPAPDGARLFLNTSPGLILDDRFAAMVPTLPPHVLEITEHQPVDDYGPLRERLQLWQGSGTLVAIDDVGAGYATMAHVVRLGPAFIKIDRSLIAGLHRDRDQRALVAALAAFAAQVGASCIAEGIELAAELDVLADLGVDLAQGYLIARPATGWPLPADTARSGAPSSLIASPSKPFARMRASLETATAPQPAADAVCRYLFEHRRLLPSVYVMRAGHLRCLARRGQWHVLDGMPAGAGITGEAFAQRGEVVALDVTKHRAYRPATPGVLAEMALPIFVRGAVIGVLNADCLTTLSDADMSAMRSCAELLGDRLAQIGTGLDATTPLQELSRVARQASTEQQITAIAVQTVASAVALSTLDTAALFFDGDDGLALVAVTGEHPGVLTALVRQQVLALADLVDGLASVHTGGGSLDVAFGPMAVLRDRGVKAVLVVPVRAAGGHRGLLIATSCRTASIPGTAVEAVELLGLHIGTTLAARAQLEQLHTLAYRDQLTGVGNRTRFEEVLTAHDLRAAGAPAGAPPVSRREAISGHPAAGAITTNWLALLDVDRFKQINDRLGHAAGDKTLRRVAQLLASSVRNDDHVFRLGGDEFAVMLTDMDDVTARRTVARLLRSCTAILAPLGAGLSAGLAELIEHHPAAVALANADRELYHCKSKAAQTRLGARPRHRSAPRTLELFETL